MFSLNTKLFLSSFTRLNSAKALARNRTIDSIYLKFVTCAVQLNSKAKDPLNLFTPVNVKPSINESKVGEELTGTLDKFKIVKIINAFYRKPEVKILAQENGLDDSLCMKGFISFRKFCVESETLPADLHIVLSDISKNSGNTVDIFPYFLRHVKEMFPHLECMEDLRKIGDIRFPANWYPEARSKRRKIYFHSGPTNSGKTYHAIQSFLNAETGLYCGPLKLLAVEVHQKANKQGIPCDLITGEEIIYVKENGDCANHVSCTIEMCSLEKSYDVAVLDEVQMIRDPNRGYAWTRALLGLKAKEIHLCGEEGAVDIIDSILCTTDEELEVIKFLNDYLQKYLQDDVKTYQRLTTLKMDKPVKDFANVLPGDCIVCFNRNDIYSVTRSLENLGKTVGVIYGSLPPQTKLSQCLKFNDPNDPCNLLVATDAIGMGLNLSIRRIVFYSLIKTTVTDRDIERVPISVSQALQIAGRAGRYGTQYEEGLVTTFKEQDLDTLKYLLSQKPEPVSSAGILPTVDQIELYSYYLPHSSLCELIDIFINLSTVDDSLYFMCDLKDFKYLAQMIDHLLLPLRIKYVFCCAPVNKRNNFTCVMFVKFAKMYSENKPVLFKWICKQIDWPARKPKNLRHLEQLETLHEILDVYLWLSNRFEEYFPDGAVIRKIQIEIEMLINEGVVNITKLMSTDEDETVLNSSGSEGSTNIAKKLREKEFQFTDWKKLAKRRRRAEHSENDIPYSREKFIENGKDCKSNN